MKKLIALGSIVLLSACSQESPQSTQNQAEKKAPQTEKMAEAPAAKSVSVSLDEALAMQDEGTKVRYEYRHPKETLEFFGIQSGMTVVEALPGGGWYSKILVPYLGSEGKLVGLDYAIDMWPNFSFTNDEFLEKRKDWPTTWTKDANSWYGDKGATVSAYTFANIPEDLSEKADAVLFIRALHNLNRFEANGEFFTKAIAETHRILKSDGIVGVVQHQAPEDKADEWADGSRGYLKKSLLVAAFENAGFELVKESDINANPKDQPGEEDIVWRLPPSLATSKEDEEAKANFQAIGESNRMTLVFKKKA